MVEIPNIHGAKMKPNAVVPEAVVEITTIVSEIVPQSVAAQTITTQTISPQAVAAQPISTVRVMKRLRAAVGYHELGMTLQALGCLDKLTTMGDTGSFALVIDILRGEVVKGREQYMSAANALKVVACMVSDSERRAITKTLAACFGENNKADRETKRASKDFGPSR